MVKTLLFFSGMALLFYFFNNSNHSFEIVTNKKKATSGLYKDKQLHHAFEKILDHKEQKRTPSADQTQKEIISNNSIDTEQSLLPPAEFSEEFKNEMTAEEQKVVINNLRIEIAGDKENLSHLRDLEKYDEALVVEEGLRKKENHLRIFLIISY